MVTVHGAVRRKRKSHRKTRINTDEKELLVTLQPNAVNYKIATESTETTELDLELLKLRELAEKLQANPKNPCLSAFTCG